MADTLPLLADIVESFSRRFPPTHRLALVFDGCGIEVGSNCESLIGHLRRYYGEFAQDRSSPQIRILAWEAPPPPFDVAFTVRSRAEGKKAPKEEHLDLPDGRVVRKLRTGMVFLCGRAVHAAVGACQANRNQVINFIDNRYLQWRLSRGGLLFHAAGVCSSRRGLALTGTSSAGKSTLALHLLARGMNFVSNDRLVVGRRGDGLHMHGLAKLPRVNPGTLLNNPHLAVLLDEQARRRYEAMDPRQLWGVEDKYDVDLDRCFGAGKRLLSGTMSGMVVLNWALDGASTEVRPVELAGRGDLLRAVTRAPGVFFTAEPAVAEGWSDAEYLNLLGACPVFEMRGRVDFAAAAEACAAFLTGRRDQVALV